MVGSVEYVTPLESTRENLRPPFLHRITAHQLQVIDYVIAALLVFLSAVHGRRTVIVGSHLGRGGVGSAGFIAGNVGVVIGVAVFSGAGIALRRRYPMLALTLLTAATAVAIVTGESYFASPFIVFPVYQVASQYERRRSLAALVGACVVVLVAMLISVAYQTTNGIGSLAILASVAAWFVGDSVRVRRTYVAGLADQAAQRQREVLERAQRSVAEERLQIARELHDVVAHSLSVIAVQSGVGRHVIDEHPAQAKKALAAVEETSRTALDELRRMLGVLRHDDQRPASLRPAPGVGSLDQLVEQVRAAGVEVDLAINTSMVSGLSATADLAIYRIAQEALTNVVKHTGHASVRVELRDEPGVLVLEVLDDGGDVAAYPQRPEDPNAHHGIVGMRERVALFAGSLEAAPRPEGGFRVLARLPAAALGSS
jgi:signal transduction histidine kinase